jgi:phosphodiesterase/alkaline phosphatase D-like protein
MARTGVRTAIPTAATMLALGLLVLAPAATAAAPGATTGPVGAVGGTTATLKGTVSPGGQATTWQFEYGPTTSYGTKTTARNAGSGTAAVDVSADLTGLTPGTTYHYRLTATNAAGTARGADGIFSTAPLPAAVTGAASDVTPTAATVAGTVDPNGLSTTWFVELGTSTSYGTRTDTGTVAGETAAVPVTVRLSGLQPGRTYHYRVVATSGAGTSRGADRTFVTIAPPTARTAPATLVGPTSARLNGAVNPGGRATSWWFEYGTSTRYGSRTAARNAGSGGAEAAVQAQVTGLRQGTTYHFRLVARSSEGTATGADAMLTTDPYAAVVTAAATSVTATSAVFNGTVNPRGRATTWWFEYGTSTRDGSRTAIADAGVDATAIAVSAPVGGLRPNTSYSVRLVARSSVGTFSGANVRFHTTAAPEAATRPPTSIGPSSATVGGTVNPAGRAASVWVEYGRTRGYGFRTNERAVPAVVADVPVSFALTGLRPGLRYHYRVVARSDTGTAAGADASFATVSLPRTADGRTVRCTVVGTPGPDRLRGGPGREVICGLGGADRIAGGGGADLIFGGAGDDVLLGGAGNDVLEGGVGRDELLGGTGADRLRGGAGSDALLGGSGTDVLAGGRGNDVVLGGSGRDRLAGGPGRDRLLACDGRRDVVLGDRRDRVVADRFDVGTALARRAR